MCHVHAQYFRHKKLALHSHVKFKVQVTSVNFIYVWLFTKAESVRELENAAPGTLDGPTI